VWAEEQPKVLDILDPTDIVKHYIGPKIPDHLITKFKSIAPDVPGDVKLKKMKEFHWSPDNSTATFYTDLDNPDSLGMKYYTENSNSSLFLDDDGDFQLNWSFKKTFNWNK
tara:strand:+ start:167 stop:499 length:333 start_codon:yes stop_codon:yes gene_type:complete